MSRDHAAAAYLEAADTFAVEHSAALDLWLEFEIKHPAEALRFWLQWLDDPARQDQWARIADGPLSLLVWSDVIPPALMSILVRAARSSERVRHALVAAGAGRAPAVQGTPLQALVNDEA